MPHISLSLYKGRNCEEIEKICKDLQQCLIETAGWKPEDISVSAESLLPSEFAGKVKAKIKNETVVISSDYIKGE